MSRSGLSPVNGILILDKPAGFTSNGALQKVRKLLAARKAGHGGSLDSMATGVLPICFGHATRTLSLLLEADKVYQGLCRLGVTTTTADGDGEIVRERPVPELGDQDIERALEGMRGVIKQVPPMYSALKHKGRRLYDLARQGIEVKREGREITIHELRLESREGNDLSLYVHCSKGTYIRTLAEDIGSKLGCGAHLAALRRLRAGPFSSEDMVGMEEIEAADMERRQGMLLPVDKALSHYPRIEVAPGLRRRLCHGNPVSLPDVPASGSVRLYDDNSELFAVGKILADGRVAPSMVLKGDGDA